MKRPSTTRSVAVIAVAGLLALTGCSDSKDGGETGSDGKSTVKAGPLEEFFSDMYGTFDEADWEKQMAEQEAITATCMAEKGFEYTPQDNSGMVSVSSDDMEDQNTEEWVASNGYGYYTSGEATEEPTDDPTEWVDPNADYVATLSEEGQQAFYAALSGEPIEPTDEELAAMDEGEGIEWNWEDGGCQGFAQHEVMGDQEDIQEAHKPLMDALDDFYTQMQAAPEIAALEPAWSSCMADAGFTFTKQQDAWESVSTLYNDLWESVSGDIDPAATEDPDFVYPEPSKEDYATVKETEVKTALADFRCKQEVKWDEVTAKVSLDLETQFVKDHKAELDAYKADYQKSLQK